MNWRRVVGWDWYCIGCDREGTLRWLQRHDCPERDRFQAEARQKWGGKRFFTYYLPIDGNHTSAKEEPS